MQIIGMTENGFILKASKSELKKSAGYYYNECPILEIGIIFNIHDMYNHAEGLLGNHKRIKNINKELEKIMKFTKKISPIIAPEYKEENAK